MLYNVKLKPTLSVPERSVYNWLLWIVFFPYVYFFLRRNSECVISVIGKWVTPRVILWSHITRVYGLVLHPTVTLCVCVYIAFSLLGMKPFSFLWRSAWAQVTHSSCGSRSPNPQSKATSSATQWKVVPSWPWYGKWCRCVWSESNTFVV